MAFCRFCGYQLEEGAKFCPKCGEVVSSEQKENPIGATSQQTASEQPNKMGCWTKGLIAFAVFGFIGFLADMCDGEAEKDNSAQTTEQVRQETEEERQAREQKEEAERQAQEQKEEEARRAREQKEKEAQKNKIAEEGYKRGYETGFSCSYHEYETFHWDRMARQEYTAWHGAPNSSEEKELFNIFQENYIKGVEDGYKAQ